MARRPDTVPAALSEISGAAKNATNVARNEGYLAAMTVVQTELLAGGDRLAEIVNTALNPKDSPHG